MRHWFFASDFAVPSAPRASSSLRGRATTPTAFARHALRAATLGAALGCGLIVAGPLWAAPTTGGDELGPKVQILSPTTNEVLDGKTRIVLGIRATRFNPQSIEMFVDGKSATNGPLPLNQLASASFDWDTRLFPDGTHKLTVRVTDTQGFRGWAEVDVLIRNSEEPISAAPPSLKWKNVQGFQELSGQAQVEVETVDGFGVKWIIVAINPANNPDAKPALRSWMLNRAPYAVNFDTTDVPDGLYSLSATAYDALEQQGEAPTLTVKVANNRVNAAQLPRLSPDASGSSNGSTSDLSLAPSASFDAASKGVPGAASADAVTPELADIKLVPMASAPQVTPQTAPQTVPGVAPNRVEDVSPPASAPAEVPDVPGVLPAFDAPPSEAANANEPLGSGTIVQNRTAPRPSIATVDEAAPAVAPAPVPSSDVPAADVAEPAISTPVAKSPKAAPAVAAPAVAAPTVAAPVVAAPAPRVAAVPRRAAGGAQMSKARLKPEAGRLTPVAPVVAPAENTKALVAARPTSVTRSVVAATTSPATAVTAKLAPEAPVVAATPRRSAPSALGRAVMVMPSVQVASRSAAPIEVQNAAVARFRAPRTETPVSTARPVENLAKVVRVSRAATPLAPSWKSVESEAVEATAQVASAPRLSRDDETDVLARIQTPIKKEPIWSRATRGAARRMTQISSAIGSVIGSATSRVRSLGTRATRPDAASMVAQSAPKVVKTATSATSKTTTPKTTLAALPRPSKTASGARGAAITVAPLEAASSRVVPSAFLVNQTMSLRDIAARFGVPVELIAAANEWPVEMNVARGMKVKLPRPLQVAYNGKPVDGDAPSMLLGNTGVTAFRFLFEQTGGTLEWDAKNQRVLARKGEQQITLSIGSKVAQVNDREVMMELAAFLFEGRTMVPIRFFEEGLQAKVEWDPQTGRLVVAMKGDVAR